jgi:hypothetical protein
MNKSLMTEENLEDSAVSVARSRWLDANERASSLEAELFQPGSGYGDLDARIADMHRLVKKSEVSRCWLAATRVVFGDGTVRFEHLDAEFEREFGTPAWIWMN